MNGVTALSRSAYFGAKPRIPYRLDEASIKKAKQLSVDRDGFVVAPFDSQLNTLTADVNTYSSDVTAVGESKKLRVVGLEYLWDPRPITKAIRRVLIGGGEADVIIGLKGGYFEWSAGAACSFFAAMGLQAKVIDSPDDYTHLSLSCTKRSYNSFLHSNNLPESTFSHLIVTTEHADYRVTGGIGSYVKECDNLYGEGVAILIIDNSQTLDKEKIASHKWFSAQSFLGDGRVSDIHTFNYDTYGDIVQEALECIVALYDNVESVESQEMLLNRSIDAKRIQLLPNELKLITMCHGSSIHLAKAKRTVLDAENVHVAYREKYSIEHSDVVVLPTDFLRASYIDSGLESLNDPSRIIKRLPFDLSRLPEGKGLKRYERLIYIGKTSTIKGFDLFLETLLELHANHPGATELIKEVVVVVTYEDIRERHLRNLYEMVAKKFNIRIVTLSRSDLFNTLSDYSENSLALVTYRGDNHPLAVLELMAIGVDFIAANAAGTPELILEGFRDHNLAPAEPKGYAKAVSESLLHAKERSTKVAEVRELYRKQQQEINDSYNIAELRKMPVLSRTESHTLHPVEIEIIGNEGSPEYKTTKASIEAQTYGRISIGRNKKAAHYMRLYAGDVIEPYAVEMMIRGFLDAKIGAVMSDELVMAYEGDGRRKGIEEFHPYPPQIGSVFLQEKYARRVVALFREYPARDEYTDWLRCVTLTCEGRGVRVIPMRLMKLIDLPDYFIDDPVKLSSQFSHSFTALTVFDASILYSELRRFDDIYWGLKRVNHLEEYFIPREEISVYGYHISPKVVRIVGAYERFTPTLIKNTVSAAANGVFWALRRIKRFVKSSAFEQSDETSK